MVDNKDFVVYKKQPKNRVRFEQLTGVSLSKQEFHYHQIFLKIAIVSSPKAMETELGNLTFQVIKTKC